MRQRPLAVTIVGWGLVVYGLYQLVNDLRAILFLGSPESTAILDKTSAKTRELVSIVLDIAMGWYLLLSAGEIFIGMFVLAGAKWARNLFVAVFLLNLLVDYCFFPGALIWDAVTGGVVIVVLFLPATNQYFLAASE